MFYFLVTVIWIPNLMPKKKFLGDILKQGPAPCGHADANCDDECRQEETRRWKPIFRFKDTDVDINDVEKFELCQDDKQVMVENLIMLRYTDDGYSTVHGGTKYFVKNSLDPVTDVILSEGDVSSDEELVSISRDIFGYKFRQNPEIFRRDLLKNSPAEGLHPLK